MYNHAILGGTFDRLHIGHKQLLETAFMSSQKVTLGLTTKILHKDKVLSEIIENYHVREKNLKEYISSLRYANKLEIIPLTDIFGNALIEKDIDAIFVTDAGIKNTTIINSERLNLGFEEIKVITVPLLLGPDNNVISSTRIRSGEIDREGTPYLDFFKAKPDLVITDELRISLSKPLGHLHKSIDEIKIEEQDFIIVVGDITTYKFIQNKITPHVSLFDLKSERNEINDSKVLDTLTHSLKTLPNPNGTISVNTVEQLHQSIQTIIISKNKVSIKIEGEEDLLVLPLVLLSPLNARIFYGQPGEGIVEIKVSEQTKETIQKNYLEKFTIS